MGAWTVVVWIGKILFVAVFVSSGINHLTNLKGMAGYAQSKGVPAAPVMVAATGLMMLVAPVMILLRWNEMWGALLLVLFLVPTAFTMHNFWVETDPGKRMGEQVHFLKDLALAGGALLYAACVRGM